MLFTLLYVPLYRCTDVPTAAFLSLRTNIERISMKFVGGNHNHQQMN